MPDMFNKGNEKIKRPKSLSFTQHANRIARVIESNISVINSDKIDIEKPSQDQNLNFYKCIAVWDTGATRTIITQKVIDTLELGIVGFQQIVGVGGKVQDTTEHVVDILLPNQVIIGEVPVLKGILPGKTDVLIGMDIITLGDFAVTNHNEQTVMTFRIPSLEIIDFVKQGMPSQNALCPCGSGKKYKRCHGNNKN